MTGNTSIGIRPTFRRITALTSAALLLCLGASPAQAGWAGLTKYLYGPNETVMIDVGFIDFYGADFWGNCDVCPPAGQCDPWAGVNLTALIYVVPTGAVSGTQNVALDPLAVVPAQQVIQATSTSGFVDESLGQTGPNGPFEPGIYDVIFDECEDHRFHPDKDAIVATFAVGYVDIEFIDPNPHLMSGGQIITNWNALGTYVPTPEIDDLVADGVTRLVLRVADLPGSGSVTFRLQDAGGQTSSEIGELGQVGSSGGGSETTSSTHLMPDDSYAAFAVLTGPLDFVPAAGGAMSPSRGIQIEAEYNPDSGGSVPPATEGATLYRPPVVLVHGLWSSSGTWGWSIMSDPRFLIVHAVDYSGSNADHFHTNVDKPRRGVQTAVGIMRAIGIAATQADVFGHSMGGALSRMYAADYAGDYIRDDNFRQGDIHKLVSVDTPHEGSPLANVLVDTNGAKTLIGRVLEPVLGCMDCGAVHDLRPDSPAITGMPSASVPAHAIVGKGGSDAIELALMQTLPGYGRMILTVLEFFGVLEDLFPPGFQHDVVVGRLSQEDGLGTGSSQTSVFGLELGVSWGLHNTVTWESAVSDRAAELLEAEIDGGMEFGSGFSGAPTPAPMPFPTPAFNTRDDALTITSPAPGASIQPGQPLTVTVEPLGDYTPSRVMVVCSEDVVVDELAPFELTLDIPVEAIGELVLNAYAFDPNEVLAEAAPVSVDIDPLATLTSLTIQPSLVQLHHFSPTQQLTVMGQFDDGVSREISGAVFGTAYASGDECRLSVDAGGLLTARYVGVTSVTVSNGSLQKAVGVQILSAPGDYDGDGDIDLSDLSAMLASYGMCVGDPAFNPDADLDRSGCIDLSDLAELLGIYGSSCP